MTVLYSKLVQQSLYDFLQLEEKVKPLKDHLTCKGYHFAISGIHHMPYFARSHEHYG